jgi:hypothetical protein
MQPLDASDAAPRAAQVRSTLHDLIEDLRSDLQRVKDPKALALFETSAEVLGGLERAFSHFQSRSEAAWQK